MNFSIFCSRMGRNRRDKSDRRKKVEEKPDQRKLIKTQPPSKNDQILRDVVCSIRNGYFYGCQIETISRFYLDLIFEQGLVKMQNRKRP